MGQKLSKTEQLDLFCDLFGAYELIEYYIKKGGDFCEEAQLKMFELSAPQNEDLVIMYLEKGHRLCEKAEVKLFDLPLGEMLLEHYCYISLYPLSDAAQMKLLEQPETWFGFLKRYIRANKKTPNYFCSEFRNQAKKRGLM